MEAATACPGSGDVASVSPLAASANSIPALAGYNHYNHRTRRDHK